MYRIGMCMSLHNEFVTIKDANNMMLYMFTSKMHYRHARLLSDHTTIRLAYRLNCWCVYTWSMHGHKWSQLSNNYSDP